MTATSPRTAVDAVPGGSPAGFPDALFTIADDPGSLRAAAQSYRPMAWQAQATHDTLTSTAVESWVGSEGDLFRTRRAAHEPMMTTAQRAFTSFVATVDAFADTLT